MIQFQHIPQSRFVELPRPRLLQVASESDILILLGGPGTGKSVAAAQIAKSLDDETAAWCRVSPETTSNEDFWQLVLLAVGQRSVPGMIAHNVLLGGGAEITPELAYAAFQEFESPVTLVIDDAHVVKELPALQLLARIAADTPTLSLIITTRSEITAFESFELRMRVPVRTIDEAELAFTREEIKQLLSMRVGSLTADQVEHAAATIEKDSAGWPIAVHAGIIERADPQRTEMRLGRSNFASNYVTNLLQTHSADEIRVLYAATILDEVSVRVIAAVLDESEDHVQRILDSVSETGLRYLTDQTGVRWYRHHDLIRDEIRASAKREIPEETLKRSFSRAARVLVNTRPQLAVAAAFRAEDWSVLAHIMYAGTSEIHLVNRPESLLEKVPQHARDKYPVLAVYALVSEIENPKIPPAQIFQKLQRLVKRRHTVDVYREGDQAEITPGLRMSVARLLKDEELALELAYETVSGVSKLSDEEIRDNSAMYSPSFTQTAVTFLYAEKFAEAECLLDRFVSVTAESPPKVIGHVYSLQALLAAWQGKDPSRWLEACRTREIPVGWHSNYAGVGYRIANALQLLATGEPAEAQAQLEELRVLTRTTEYWPYFTLMESFVAEFTRGQNAALRVIQRNLKRRMSQDGTVNTLHRRLLEEQSRLLWHLGSTDATEEDAPGLYGIYETLRAGKPLLARSRLSELLNDSTVSPRKHAEALMLSAYLFETAGEHTNAKHSMCQAVALIDQNRFRLPARVIPGDALDTLIAYVPDLNVTVPQVADRQILSLTKAELRTLTAVAKHGTNRAAAQALYLSDNTVKTHLRGVFQKLGVSKREDALREAAKHGLLGEIL